jgi:hypothetical protein
VIKIAVSEGAGRFISAGIAIVKLFEVETKSDVVWARFALPQKIAMKVPGSRKADAMSDEPGDIFIIEELKVAGFSHPGDDDA